MFHATNNTSIAWRKGKNALLIEGVEINKIMQLLCSNVCENVDPIDETGEAITAIEMVTSSLSQTEPIAVQCGTCKDAISDTQEIKFDRDSNRVAIQSLSGSVHQIN